MGFADQAFDFDVAKSKFEEKLDNLKIPFQRFGWDYYDCSLELRDVCNEYRLSAEAQEFIFNEGFFTVYLNHKDCSETHYNFEYKSPFAVVKGWRRIRCPDGHFQINFLPKGWGEQGEQWIKSGYMEVINED